MKMMDQLDIHVSPFIEYCYKFYRGIFFQAPRPASHKTVFTEIFKLLPKYAVGLDTPRQWSSSQVHRPPNEHASNLKIDLPTLAWPNNASRVSQCRRLNVDAWSHSLSPFTASRGAFLLSFPGPLLSLIQHQAQNVKTKLRVLQAHGLEFGLGLVAQNM